MIAQIIIMTEIENYIANCDDSIQDVLSELRNIIINNAPALTEKIAWGMPTFVLNGKNLVHFASHKNHVGLYPGAEAIVCFEEKLKGYKTSKGTVQFSYDNQLPVELIAEIVQFCVSANLSRVKKK